MSRPVRHEDRPGAGADGARGEGVEILELFVQGRAGPGSPCEDLVAQVGPFVIVLDGVSSKDAALYGTTTSGLFAAEAIVEAAGTLGPAVTAREGVDVLSQALRSATETLSPGQLRHLPGAQLAVYSSYRREIWRVGDVRARIGAVELPLYAPPTDQVVAAFRSALLSSLLLEGVSEAELLADDPSLPLVWPLLSHQDLFANLATPHEYAYGVINGTHVPDRHIHVDKVARGQEVVFATDGYLSAAGTLSDAERQLALALREDPLMISSYPALRSPQPGGSFDDRAWIRFLT